MTFEAHMQRIVSLDRQSLPVLVLEESRALRDALLGAPATDPVQHGWARYYLLKALHQLGRWPEALALVEEEPARPWVVNPINRAWMASVAAEVALRAGRPERILPHMSRALEGRLASQDLRGARQALETACALLEQAGRPEELQRLLDHLDWLATQDAPGGPLAHDIGALLRGLDQTAWGRAARLAARRGLGLRLRAAAAEGDLERVRSLLAQGADPDAWDGAHPGLPTPLLAAAFVGHEAVVATLLAAGASAERANTQGRTPLHHAADQDHGQVVALLLAAGARSDRLDFLGLAPLHVAGWQDNVQAVQALLRGGADPLLLSGGGSSALHIAATEPVPAAIQALVEGGSPVDCRDLEGRTPLMVAAAEGLDEVTATLRALGADPALRDHHGRGWQEHAQARRARARA